MKNQIHLFGEGIRIWKLHLSTSLLEQLTNSKGGIQFEDALFDLHFLNENGINHWQDLATEKPITGLKLTNKSRIELKASGRKKRIITGNELTESTTLFPIYSTLKTVFNPQLEQNEFLVLEEEIGKIQTFEFKVDHFILEDLKFRLLEISSEEWLVGIDYKNDCLVSKKSDSVTTSIQLYRMKN